MQHLAKYLAGPAQGRRMAGSISKDVDATCKSGVIYPGFYSIVSSLHGKEQTRGLLSPRRLPKAGTSRELVTAGDFILVEEPALNDYLRLRLTLAVDTRQVQDSHFLQSQLASVVQSSNCTGEEHPLK